MAISFDVKMQGLDTLAGLLRGMSEQSESKLRRNLVRVGTKWQHEAKLRVPDETGTTRNSILYEVGSQAGEQFVACGSNQKHAPHIEFGTKWIAGGAVKKLGLGPVNDSQAIKSWPAKEADGATREQMPWLRPAWESIREWATRLIGESFSPDA